MSIEEIFSKIEESSVRDRYAFETFALQLLKIHIESQSRRFEVLKEVSDAYAPEGFDSFEGGTLIEIKSLPEKFMLQNLFEYILRIESRINKSSESKINFNNILIINRRSVSPKIIDRFNSELNTLSVKSNVIIWGPEDLNKIVSKHKKQANEISNNLFSLRLENAVKSQPEDWKKERDAKIELLRDAYERGQFSLFLGAGVSSSAGMPDWNTLLNSLFVSYLTKELSTGRVLNRLVATV